MSQINAFRFKQLFLRQLVMNRKGFLIGFAAFMGGLLFISLMRIWLTKSWSDPQAQLDVYYGLGLVAFHICGYLLSSSAFNELHNPARSQFYLMLPSSITEKLAVNWLIYSPLYVVVVMLGMVGTSIVGTLLAGLVFEAPFAVFNPLSSGVINNITVFLVLQTIFQLGAIYFRKFNALKTVFALFLTGLGIMLISVLLMYIIVGQGHISGNDFNFSGDMNSLNLDISFWVNTVFYAVVGPFFLLVSYFRLKEREV